MATKSVIYVVAFVVSMTACAKLRSRAVRQAVLLTASYAVYLTWGAWFALVLAVSTAVNYLVGKQLRQSESRLVLSIGIFLNLVMLGSFKYLPELSIALPFSSMQRFAHLALPLGISFWTFQAMSYLFDIYRGEELDPSFVEFATYMAFFPVTISGPLCRLPEVLPQFRAEDRTRPDAIRRGIARMATGFFMMEVAKLLGQGVLGSAGINAGFDTAKYWAGTDVWCLAFGFGLQLFFDFAGYSHIAIGAAQALGIVVPENFNRPFGSTTPSIFWTRWHMSLSFWIRDYVFLPLAILRREIWWRNLALLLSMVLFGVWHKASLLFVIWGTYHGVLLVLHRSVQSLQRKFNWDTDAPIWVPLSWAATISLISFGWIFFRANSLSQAQVMVSSALTPGGNASVLGGSLYLLVLLVAVLYGTTLAVKNVMDESADAAGIVGALARHRWYWIPALYVCALLIVLAITHARGSDAAQFMYSNF